MAVWRAANVEVPGAGAAIGEAFKLGKRIFGELLSGA